MIFCNSWGKHRQLSALPADVLIDNYPREFLTAFDVTISHALQPSCSIAGVEVGKSVSAACENNLAMYITACNVVHRRFVPMAMESTGTVSREVKFAELREDAGGVNEDLRHFKPAPNGIC